MADNNEAGIGQNTDGESRGHFIRQFIEGDVARGLNGA